ncbi:MAG: GGDEF domain-containing protein [Kiloniellales bacterium]|nr:GGDEF domain-containing protein [Kiloniellales bacterium]
MQSSRQILLVASEADLVRRVTESLCADRPSQAPLPALEIRSRSSLAEAAAACEAQAWDLLLLDLEALGRGAAPDALLLDHRAPLVAFRGVGDLSGLRQAVGAALARRPLDAQSIRRALYDDFTGLPTQALLIDLVNQAVARAQRSGLFVALVPFSLHGLEDCEDRFDLAKVEKIYKALLGRLTGSLRSSDVVAHFGGTDFAILMEVRNGYDDAVLVAERVREIMTDGFVFGEALLEITMSLSGPVLCEAPIDDLAPLLRQAEAADRLSASAA